MKLQQIVCYLVCGVLGPIQDDTGTDLMNLDKDKVFDNTDHRFLLTVLKASGYLAKSSTGINSLYRIPRISAVLINEKQTQSFEIS